MSEKQRKEERKQQLNKRRQELDIKEEQLLTPQQIQANMKMSNILDNMKNELKSNIYEKKFFETCQQLTIDEGKILTEYTNIIQNLRLLHMNFGKIAARYQHLKQRFNAEILNNKRQLQEYNKMDNQINMQLHKNTIAHNNIQQQYYKIEEQLKQIPSLTYEYEQKQRIENEINSGNANDWQLERLQKQLELNNRVILYKKQSVIESSSVSIYLQNQERKKQMIKLVNDQNKLILQKIEIGNKINNKQQFAGSLEYIVMQYNQYDQINNYLNQLFDKTSNCLNKYNVNIFVNILKQMKNQFQKDNKYVSMKISNIKELESKLGTDITQQIKTDMNIEKNNFLFKMKSKSKPKRRKSKSKPKRRKSRSKPKSKPKRRKSKSKPKRRKSKSKPKRRKSKPKKRKSKSKPKKRKSKSKPKKRKSKSKPKKRKSKSKPKKRKSKSKPKKRKSKSKPKSKPKRRKSKSKPKRSKSKPKRSKSKSKPKGCVKQTTKKYTSRKSPSFPANQCCGRTMVGNDGKQYFSKRASNGVCRWVLKNVVCSNGVCRLV